MFSSATLSSPASAFTTSPSSTAASTRRPESLRWRSSKTESARARRSCETVPLSALPHGGQAQRHAQPGVAFPTCGLQSLGESGHEVLYEQSECLGPRVPEEFRRGRVPEDDPAVARLRDDHRVAHGCKELFDAQVLRLHFHVTLWHGPVFRRSSAHSLTTAGRVRTAGGSTPTLRKQTTPPRSRSSEPILTSRIEVTGASSPGEPFARGAAPPLR